MEAQFIKMLGEQGYTYLNIHQPEDLIANLRTQLEELNHIQFSDKEWEQFFTQNLANANEGIVEKTCKIQEDHIQILKRDDGNEKNRYDVTVLVNGFPLIHIELKRRGVAIKEAFNQIERYQRDSFWAGAGLYEYVQIFVISNGTHTKYYSNTTRISAANNKIIADLVDFTKTFFAKHTILNIITKYCILTLEDLLLVMRPYQIVATERILKRTSELLIEPSSPALSCVSRKSSLINFVATVNHQTDVFNDWRQFVLEQKEKDVQELTISEKLKEEETRKLIDNAFRDGELKTTGTAIDRIMPPMSRFGGGGSNRLAKKQSVIDKLKAFFEKYLGLV